VNKKTPLSEVCRQVLAAQGKDWMRGGQSVLRGPTTRSVHAMRVAGRRLRAALKLFRKSLARPYYQLDRCLSEIGARLGEARDIDVHLAYLSRTLRRWPQKDRAALNLYRVFLQNRLRRARRRVRACVRAPAYRKLSAALDQLWRASPRGTDAPAAEAAWKLLKERYRKLRKTSKLVKSDVTDAGLHRFRRAIRRLRYGCQFFEPVAAPALKRLAHRLGKWQDLLGDRQDRLAGARLVAEHLSRRKRAVPLAEEKALLRLVQQLDREKQRLQDTILLHWKKSNRREIKRFLKAAFQ